MQLLFALAYSSNETFESVSAWEFSEAVVGELFAAWEEVLEAVEDFRPVRLLRLFVGAGLDFFKASCSCSLTSSAV